jgi:hypothetical protein
MNPTPPVVTAPSPELSLGNEGMGARGTETVALAPGGYIDDAIPQTLFRLRYEARWGFNEFDRAEYMYATWRELGFHPHALVSSDGNSVRGIFFDPKARGSQIFAQNLDDQDASAYLEYAFSNRLSGFADMPFRWVHFRGIVEEGTESTAERVNFPETGEVRNPKLDTGGASDFDFGVKYALIADPNCRYVTFQFRTYVPTGEPGLGLGTGHWSLEPGLLLYQRLNDRTVLQGMFTDWIPVSAGPGAGNILSYGVGLGYDVVQSCKLRITPVAEFVGWTVLGGTEAFEGTVPASATNIAVAGQPLSVVRIDGVDVPDDHAAREANGDTIVNAKLGVRTYFGERSDLYMGYGHSLTGDRWYNDTVRVEYRLHF